MHVNSSRAVVLMQALSKVRAVACMQILNHKVLSKADALGAASGVQYNAARRRVVASSVGGPWPKKVVRDLQQPR